MESETSWTLISVHGATVEYSGIIPKTSPRRTRHLVTRKNSHIFFNYTERQVKVGSGHQLFVDVCEPSMDGSGFRVKPLSVLLLRERFHPINFRFWSKIHGSLFPSRPFIFMLQGPNFCSFSRPRDRSYILYKSG